MSIEKSELHVTEIEREDKGRWVASAREKNQTLAEWVVENLNRDAHNQSVYKKRRENGHYD